MATRSPSPYHNDWGIFAAVTDLPNVAASPTQSPILEVGDTATVGAGVKYVCTLATLGAAVWTLLGGGGDDPLWEWNGVDLSQFGPVVDHSGQGAIGPTGVMTPSVIPDPRYTSRNVIRLAGTLVGGFCLPVLPSLVLPESFRMELDLESDPQTNIFAGLLNFAEVATQVQGISVGLRLATSTNVNTGAVVNDVGGAGGDIIANASSDFGSNEAGRRMSLVSRISRPRGTTPAEFQIQSMYVPGLGPRNAASGSYANRPVSLTTQWDGVSFDRIGIMVLVQTGATAVAPIFRAIRIYEET